MAVLGLPSAARAQPTTSKITTIGYVSLRECASELEEAFRHGLRELGYIEGRNINVVYRWANWSTDRVSGFATDLVKQNVDVIVVTGGNAAARAAKKVVLTLPVVFTSGDPVRAGLVPRLDRPGGNLTGINLATGELNQKRLELLTTVVPGITEVVVLIGAGMSTSYVMPDIEDAARSLNVKVRFVHAEAAADIDRAFATIRAMRARALLVVANPMFLAERQRIVRFVADSRLPAVFEQRLFVDAGGLLSYGSDFFDMYRRLASYVDKILKGARPGDLPIEQPTTFELAVNLKTARALGLTVPPSVLVRADRVID